MLGCAQEESFKDYIFYYGDEVILVDDFYKNTNVECYGEVRGVSSSRKVYFINMTCSTKYPSGVIINEHWEQWYSYKQLKLRDKE